MGVPLSPLEERVHGEPAFAAILAKQDNKQVQVYDLSSPLPVLRTLPASAVQLTKGSNWTHIAPLSRYSAAELSAIEAYLNTLP
ncbi:MAG: hypothetical protein U0R19_00475 [Bryobacteraceae bacterium]